MLKIQPLSAATGIVILLCFGGVSSGVAGDMQTLRGHVPKAVARFNLQPTGRLPATNRLELAIGLPLRNPAALDELLREIYDPASTNFHHYLTLEQFTAKFGPTEQDYEKVKDFARANGLAITGTYGNRLLLDVTGPAAAVEKAFHITLRTYRHPTEARDFFAPDVEPSVDMGLPVADIQGLSDFSRPHPEFHRLNAAQAAARATPKDGSAPDGSGAYFGDDFRNAYVPGTTLTGAGQMVGLLEFDGFYSNDIAAYAVAAGGGRTNIVIQTVLTNGVSGIPGYSGISGANEEVSLDIEMAMAIAPGLATVVVFEGNQANSVLNSMLTFSNTVKNLSCSWGWSGGPNTTTDNIFKSMQAVSQSFFKSSGDSDAFTTGASSVNGVDNTSLDDAPSSSPYITQVGGTTLTNGTGGSYLSETVWNWGYDSLAGGYVGSSGGVSSYYSIPTWQQGVNSFLVNGGSTTMRNIPDVALTADNVYVAYGNGSSNEVGGTSCAAPLWAGFMALANQQAAASGKPPVGFINPAIYELANESIYSSVFHDITTGDNTWSSSPNAFYAVPGYDLCTGLGTPAGTNLINALVNPDPLVVVSNSGFNAVGSPAGTFNISSQTFYLTNVGASSLTWSLVNTSSWLNVSTAGGTLAAGAGSPVVVSLNTVASNLNVGTYTANLWFSNVTSGVTHYRFFTLTVATVQNGGFETGDFTGWTLNGTGYPDNFVTNSITYNIGTRHHPTHITINPHSGIYFAALGEPSALAYLSQNVPTFAGQAYLLSLWMDSPDGETPNEFSVSWNGNTLFDQANLPKLGWTNLQFVVTAAGSNTVLQIGARDDTTYLALDDVSVTPILSPSISMQPTNLTILSGGNGIFSVTAGGSAPLAYQWRENGTNISNGGNISGVTTNVLTLTAATTNNDGSYSVVITNVYGAVTSSAAVLTVVLPPAITGSSLTNQTVQCGSNNLTFAVTTSGTPPLNYQWSLDGTPVSNATNTSFSLTNLHLPNHTVSVVVTNLYASLASNAIVTVQDTLPPAITLNGSNPMFVELGGAFSDPGATAVDVCAGPVPVSTSGTVNTNAVGTNILVYTATDGNGNTNMATRTVIVRDTTPPTILWSFTNLVLAAGTNCNAPMPDVTGTNFIRATDLSGPLTISQNPTNTAILPLGTNVVVITVKDAYGNAAYSTNTITVQDQTPPVILSQPQSQTNLIGSIATFSVAATACTPLSFQWYFNNGALAAKTNSTLTLSNINSTSAGNYFAVASASGGSTTSSVATLTVNLIATTVALGSSENPSGYKDSVNFTANIAPTNAAGTIQFFTNGMPFDIKPLAVGTAVSTNISLLPRGTNVIVAVYSGDANDSPATNNLWQIVTNHPPTAAPAFYTRIAGLVLDIAVTNLATNWSDLDGDTVSLVGVGVSTNGVTLTNNAGTLVYFDSNNVADQFVCTISDGWGGTNFQTVNISVVLPAIAGVVANADGSVTLDFTGAPGPVYILETTTNLSPSSWLPVATNTLGTNDVWQYTDGTATNYPQRFYRLELTQ
jgi:hypothetical protein